jgi:hypothetical protein
LGGQKETLEFAFEIGGKDALTDGRANVLKGPEATSVEFILSRLDGTVIGRTVDIDEFTLTLALKDVLTHEDGGEVSYTQFLADFTEEGLLGGLTVVKMTTYSCIPLAWLDIFPSWALLQIDVTIGIEHMEVDNGMKQARAAMALSASGLADYRACFIDYGEQLPLVVFHH